MVMLCSETLFGSVFLFAWQDTMRATWMPVATSVGQALKLPKI